jgi:beta-xylosidase
MYYAPELKNQTGIHCISLATSTQPGGPYIDTSSEPMICPAADGGAIDPAFYRDLSPADGSCYVLYKIDTPNNNKGHTMCLDRSGQANCLALDEIAEYKCHLAWMSQSQWRSWLSFCSISSMQLECPKA